MKKVLVIDFDPRGENVWLMQCNHEMSKVSASFGVNRVFLNLEDARKCMVQEVQRVSRNMLEMWQRKYPMKNIRYSFYLDDEGYDCSAEIIMDGKAVDCYVGGIHHLTIE
jgi:ribosomal protein S8